MMSFQISTSGSAGSCPGIQFLQQRQMARAPPWRGRSETRYFEPSSEWMGASVFAAVRTMLVCRRVCRIGVRIAALSRADPSGDLSANNLRGGEEMKILPVVFRRVAEQQEIKRQRFFQDGLVVVYLSIRALGPGEEDAVAWFRRIESRVVDDNWNGKASVPSSGKSQNNRGTFGSTEESGCRFLFA